MDTLFIDESVTYYIYQLIQCAKILVANIILSIQFFFKILNQFE